MFDWLERQYADIRGNLKWAVLMFLWWLITTFGKQMLSLVPHIPAYLVNAILWLSSVIAFLWIAIMIARSQRLSPKDENGDTEFRQLFVEENSARNKYQEKYAETANELNQVRRELDELKKAQKPLPSHPIPPFCEKILLTCMELKAFLGSHGDKVKTSRHPEETREQHLLRLSTPQLKEARVKYVGDYCLRYRHIVIQLRDEIRQRCAISDPELDQAIILAEDDLSGRAADDLERVIQKFWTIALHVNA